MPTRDFLGCAAMLAAMLLARVPAAAEPANRVKPLDGDYVLQQFHFASGKTLPELRLHFTTLGKPHRGAQGRVDNAVLLLHASGGSARSFLADKFSGILFGKGQLLDAGRFFLIIPDAIGHGGSSKPSDGLHMSFPAYTDDDMVDAQYRLLTQGLGVDHLRLILGTSMGCMHTWLWGERHPDFVDALMALACLPVPIAGRNRLWREFIIDIVRGDPDWQNGEYRVEPTRALRAAAAMMLIAGSAPIAMQLGLPTRDAADEFVNKYFERELPELDANDLLYQVDASRDFDASATLEAVRAAVMWVNSADDFVNPPELGIAEREIKRLPRGRFVLLPASNLTHGHGTYSWPVVWQEYLAQLLDQSKSPENPVAASAATRRP